MSRSFSRYIIFCIFIIVIVLLDSKRLWRRYDQSIIDSATNTLTKVGNKVQTITATQTTLHSHLSQIFQIYLRNSPDVEPLNNYYKSRAPTIGYNDEPFTNGRLKEFLQLPQSELDRLQKAHAHVVKELPGKFPRGLFSGTGIATVAGKRYMPVAVTTIRMLRKVSPHIPVEVFVMNQDEYEPHICEEVLPQLNAKCIILEDLYSTEMFSAFDIHGYSLKVLAIITSSFENVLFLDADSIPVNDVEDLFLKEPYTSTGYIVWPDYWQRSAAPNFYDIANIPLQGQDNNKNNNNISNVIQAHLENSMPYMSSESGQIVVDKSRHYKSLLLAGYYNVFGYNYYYPLLSQGACGEGDKETFLSAAYALNEPVYQVDTGCRTAGWFNEQGQFTGVGILQSNPYDDYLRLADEKLTPRIMFMHMNLPKMNPRELFENAEHSERLLNDDKRVRYYGSPLEQMNTYSGKDVELEIWLECQWEVCEMALNQGLVFKDWNGVDLTQLCTNVSRHVEWLKKTHNT